MRIGHFARPAVCRGLGGRCRTGRGDGAQRNRPAAPGAEHVGSGFGSQPVSPATKRSHRGLRRSGGRTAGFRHLARTDGRRGGPGRRGGSGAVGGCKPGTGRRAAGGGGGGDRPASLEAGWARGHAAGIDAAGVCEPRQRICDRAGPGRSDDGTGAGRVGQPGRRPGRPRRPAAADRGTKPGGGDVGAGSRAGWSHGHERRLPAGLPDWRAVVLAPRRPADGDAGHRPTGSDWPTASPGPSICWWRPTGGRC